MPTPDPIRKGDRLEIGDTIRIEAGPAPMRRRATPENLDNSVTADHYQIGNIDALGKPIVEGEMFSYLDHYGPRVFYVYLKRDLDPSDPRYVAAPDPNGPPLDEGSTNVTAYTYVFDEVGFFPTEDMAIEAAYAALSPSEEQG